MMMGPDNGHAITNELLVRPCAGCGETISTHRVLCEICLERERQHDAHERVVAELLQRGLPLMAGGSGDGEPRCAGCGHRERHHGQGKYQWERPGYCSSDDGCPCACEGWEAPNATPSAVDAELPEDEPVGAAAQDADEQRELELQVLYGTRDAYDHLLALCATLTRVYQDDDTDSDDVLDAVEPITEYIQANHPDWQG